MKCCPYCGKEYPDDVVKCFIDGYSLPEPVSNVPSSKEKANLTGQALDSSGAAPGSTESKHDFALTYPDYQWSARDAWKCLGTLLLIGFIFRTGVYATAQHFQAFHDWRSSGPGYLSVELLRDPL